MPTAPSPLAPACASLQQVPLSRRGHSWPGPRSLLCVAVLSWRTLGGHSGTSFHGFVPGSLLFMKGLLVCAAFVWGAQLIKGPFSRTELLRSPAGISGRPGLRLLFEVNGNQGWVLQSSSRVHCHQQLEGLGFQLMWKQGEVATESTKGDTIEGPLHTRKTHQGLLATGFTQAIFPLFLSHRLCFPKTGASEMTEEASPVSSLPNVGGGVGWG